MATDPVCGMELNPETAQHRSEHEGSVVYFCSAECKDEFDRNPKQYLTAA